MKLTGSDKLIHIFVSTLKFELKQTMSIEQRRSVCLKSSPGESQKQFHKQRNYLNLK